MHSTYLSRNETHSTALDLAPLLREPAASGWHHRNAVYLPADQLQVCRNEHFVLLVCFDKSEQHRFANEKLIKPVEGHVIALDHNVHIGLVGRGD